MAQDSWLQSKKLVDRQDVIYCYFRVYLPKPTHDMQHQRWVDVRADRLIPQAEVWSEDKTHQLVMYGPSSKNFGKIVDSDRKIIRVMENERDGIRFVDKRLKALKITPLGFKSVLEPLYEHLEVEYKYHEEPR